MTSIAMYPEQVNAAWQTGPAQAPANQGASLSSILLNGLSRTIDATIDRKFTPRVPDVQGLTTGGYTYTAGQTAGLLATPNAGLFLLLGGAALVLYLALR